MTPTDIHALLAEDDDEAEPALRRRRSWTYWAAGAAALSLVLLVIAGNALSEARLGAATAFGECSTSLALALVIVVAAGVALGAARIASDVRFASEILFEPERWLAVLPPPALMLAATMPAFTGCPWAARFAEWPLVGGVLVGTPGLVLAGASAFGVGLALTLAVRVRVPIAHIVEAYEHARRQAEASNLPGDDEFDRRDYP